MKKKAKETFNKYWLWVIAQMLIWLVPMILTIVMMCETRDAGIGFSIGGVSFAIVVAFTYFIVLKKKLDLAIEHAKIEENRIPPLLRFIQGLVTVAILGGLCCLINATITMWKEVLTSMVIITASVAVGYVLLIIDSARKKPQHLLREK